MVSTEVLYIDQCEESFEELKKRLTTAPVLALPVSNEDFTVFCDASRVGLGCVLKIKTLC